VQTPQVFDILHSWAHPLVLVFLNACYNGSKGIIEFLVQHTVIVVTIHMVACATSPSNHIIRLCNLVQACNIYSIFCQYPGVLLNFLDAGWILIT
jgi:hypothetical protein